MQSIKITNSNLEVLRELIEEWNDYKVAGVSDADNPIQFYADKTVVEVYDIENEVHNSNKIVIKLKNIIKVLKNKLNYNNNKTISTTKRTSKLIEVYDYSKTDSFCDEEKDYGLMEDSIITYFPLLNTLNIKNMNSMFYDCKNLKEIPLLDTSNVVNMSLMFDGCENLKKLPPLNTKNVKDMRYMFYGCKNLQQLPNTILCKLIQLEYKFDEIESPYINNKIIKEKYPNLLF